MADDVFNIDFSNDSPDDMLDLSSMIADAAGGNKPPVETPPAVDTPPAQQQPPAAEPKKEEEDLLELPDDGFEAAVKKEGQAAPAAQENIKETDTSSSEEPSTSPYSSLAKLFHERGVISDLEGFDKLTMEDGVEGFMNKLQDKLIDGVTSEMNDTQKEYYESLKAGVPTEFFHEKKSVIQQLDSIKDEVLNADTDEAKNLRYNLMYNDYVSKGFSAEEAKESALDQFKLGKDKERAKLSKANYRNSLQAEIDAKKEAGLKEQEEAKKNEEQLLENLKSNIYDTNEIIPGLKINKTTQDKVYNAVSNIVGYDENGKPVNVILKAIQDNPEEMQAKLGYLWVVTDGFKSMKNLNSKASSKVAREVEDMIINGTLTGNTESVKDIPSTQQSKSLVSSLKALGIGEKSMGSL